SHGANGALGFFGSANLGPPGLSCGATSRRLVENDRYRDSLPRPDRRVKALGRACARPARATSVRAGPHRPERGRCGPQGGETAPVTALDRDLALLAEVPRPYEPPLPEGPQ